MRSFVCIDYVTVCVDRVTSRMNHVSRCVDHVMSCVGHVTRSVDHVTTASSSYIGLEWFYDFTSSWRLRWECKHTTESTQI